MEGVLTIYNPRQPHIGSGVNGGRFCSYGAPHATTSSNPKVGHSRDRRTAKQGKGTIKRKGIKAKRRHSATHRANGNRQLTVSQRAKAKSRSLSRAAYGGKKARKR